MTYNEKTIRKFIQEILKTEGLVAADQISALAITIFGEEGDAFFVSSEKQEELNELLHEINQEIHAAREAHESGQKKAKGYEGLIKPFKDMFYYMSENIHESRAKKLALEAAQLFLQESAAQLIEEAISVKTVNNVKSMALEAAQGHAAKLKGADSEKSDKDTREASKTEHETEKSSSKKLIAADMGSDANKNSKSVSDKKKLVSA